MTQTDMVLEYLKENETITTWQAYELFGITRLSAKIFDLRKMGYNISSNNTTKVNRYGRKVTFSTYRLEV